MFDQTKFSSRTLSRSIVIGICRIRSTCFLVSYKSKEALASSADVESRDRSRSKDNKEYNYHFYIKIHIPSLNAYENWKQIIPNLNFNATTRELIIPSKDEQSALALINLIYMNFMGQISLTNILEKNLIQISINKCKAYKVIENKIRDQINDNLNGNVNAKINVLYEKDLSSIQNSDQKNSKKINFLNMDTNNELNNRRLDNQELNNSSKFFNSYSDSTVEAVEASRDSLNIFKSLETDPQPYDGSYFSYI